MNKYARRLAALLLFVSFDLFGQDVYFPLHVGNRWQYKSFDFDSTVLYSYNVDVVSETLFANGKTYYKLQRYEANGTPFYSPEFLREDSNRVYEYEQGSGECVRYDFSTQPSMCWNTLYGKGTSTVFGRRLRGYRFLNMIPGFGGLVVDSIGVVQQFIELHTPDDLTGAFIDGITYGTLDGVENETSDRVNDFHLSQNYPNPFNPNTHIDFRVPAGPGGILSQVRISLKIFDLLGREVVTLVDSKMLPGSYGVTWDGTTAGAGIYFYRLEGENSVEVRKMVLVK